MNSWLIAGDCLSIEFTPINSIRWNCRSHAARLGKSSCHAGGAEQI